MTAPYSQQTFASWADMDFNAHMRVGPVVLKDEVEYFREVQLLQEITVTLACWLDLAVRRPTVPPPALHTALRSLARTEDFEALRTMIKEPKPDAAPPGGSGGRT